MEGACPATQRERWRQGHPWEPPSWQTVLGLDSRAAEGHMPTPFTLTCQGLPSAHPAGNQQAGKQAAVHGGQH